MSENTKIQEKIIREMDSRLERLEAHQNDIIDAADNQFEELNQTLSKVINGVLTKEIKDLRDYVSELQ